MAKEYGEYTIEHFRDGYTVFVDGNDFYFDTYREAVEFIERELTK